MLAEYDIPFVVDKVICGFGLIGEMFGSTTYAVRPDVMVLSRQIESSYVPFSAIVMNARFFTPMADESDRIRTFGQGYTADGHPLGAAVALENLTIIDEDDLVGNARDVGANFRARLEALKYGPLFGEVRGVEAVEDEVPSRSRRRASWV